MKRRKVRKVIYHDNPGFSYHFQKYLEYLEESKLYDRGEDRHHIALAKALAHLESARESDSREWVFS